MRQGLIAVLMAASLAAGAWGQVNPLARDRLAGTYRNEQMTVELRQAGSGQYQGTIQFQGQSFPIAASGGGASLKGAFVAQGQSFSFTATLDGTKLRLVTDGAEHVLEKTTATAAVPPPAGPAASPAAASPAGAAQSGKAHRHPAGISVQVPVGWNVHDGPSGVALLPPGMTLQDATANDEIYVVSTNAGYQNPDDPRLLQELQNGFAQSGMTFTRAAERQTFAAGGRNVTSVTWEGRHPQTAVPMIIRLYMVPATGRVQSLLAIGPKERVDRWEPQLRQAAGAMGFDAAVAAAALKNLADDSPAARMWLEKLRGKLLTQMSASAGMSSKRVIHLSADGGFSLSGNSMVSIDVGPYAQAPTASALSTSREGGSGRWRILGRGGQAFLELKGSDGSERVYELTSQGTATFLDGVRTFVTEPE